MSSFIKFLFEKTVVLYEFGINFVVTTANETISIPLIFHDYRNLYFNHVLPFLLFQLLATTIQHEKPELEVRKTELLKQEEDLKIQLAELEESLLEVSIKELINP